jgi:chemotaxis protein CheX
MKTEDLTDAFSRAITHILKTMANIEPRLVSIDIDKEKKIKGDVSGIIGLSSETQRISVALSFSKEAALLVYSAMMGEDAADINTSVGDLIGELTNMLGGNARNFLSEKGIRLTSSLPKVVIGEDQHIHPIGDISTNILYSISGHTMLIGISTGK